MKKTAIIIFLLVFLLSCGEESSHQSLDEMIAHRFEQGKIISLYELVEEDWDSAWLVNGFDKGASLPGELALLEPFESPRLILIKKEELRSFEFADAALLLYPKSLDVNAFEVNSASEFLIDKVDGKYRLLYLDLSSL